MDTTHAAAFDISDAHAWILYLNPEIHTNEKRLIDSANLDTFVLMQDVRNCPGGSKHLPPWMSVLPVLVDTKNRLAYRGDTCLSKLVTIELPPEYAKKLAKPRRNNWTSSTDEAL